MQCLTFLRPDNVESYSYLTVQVAVDNFRLSKKSSKAFQIAGKGGFPSLRQIMYQVLAWGCSDELD